MDKFKLGQICMTSGIAESISSIEVTVALRRHASGDWGVICDEDKAENEFAVVNGVRILSSYRSTSNEKFWIITEADRSVTTVLLSEEY